MPWFTNISMQRGCHCISDVSVSPCRIPPRRQLWCWRHLRLSRSKSAARGSTRGRGPRRSAFVFLFVGSPGCNALRHPLLSFFALVLLLDLFLFGSGCLQRRLHSWSHLCFPSVWSPVCARGFAPLPGAPSKMLWLFHVIFWTCASYASNERSHCIKFL